MMGIGLGELVIIGGICAFLGIGLIGGIALVVHLSRKK